MMSFRVRTAALLVLLACASGAPAGAVSTVTDLHYAVQDGRSRLTLTFTGDIRFSADQVPGGVRLAFSQTRTGARLQALRRNFPTGHVQTLSWARFPGDSLVMTLALAAGSTYRCVCPSSGGVLFVDVQGGTPRAAVAARTAPAKPVTPRTVNVERTPPAEAQRTATPLIDIPAVARKQLEGIQGTDAPRTEQEAAVRETSGMPVAVRVMLSVAISLLMTAAGLVLLRKHLDARPATMKAVPRPTPAPARPGQLAQYAAPVSADRAQLSATSLPEAHPLLDRIVRDQDDDDEDPGRETSLQLARTFRRGSEEITLAHKFHQHAAPTLTPARMETALSKATTRAQRLHAARKLGVGRGEFDLAAKLRSMQTEREKKEEQP